jgi:type I restriction enzyme S subunit
MTFDKSTLSPISKLGDLLELVIDYRGKTPKKLGGDFTDAGVPVISAIHIKHGKIVWEERERFVTKEMFLKWMKDPLKKGDVLLTSEAPLGEVALVPNDEDLVLSQRLFALRTKSELLDSNYLMYFFQSSLGQEELKGRSSGSTVIGIRQAELVNIAVPCPPIAQQRVVGEVLATIDAKISANEGLSKTLEDIAQTIFKSWFIDFDPVKAKMAGKNPAGMDAATAALFPDSMEESELGLIPKGWCVGSLGEIADLQGGYAFKSSSWTESGVPVIKIGSVKPGFVDLTQVSYIDAPTAEAIPDDYRIPAGSLVVGLTGYVGQVGLVRTHDPVPLVNQRVAKFKLKSGEWKIPFIYCFTRGEKFKGIVEELATGTAQQNVSNSQILSIPMVIPNEHIREMFDNSFKPFFQEIINLADENESLKSTRDALLPRLISGELQIPEEILAS